MSPLPRTVSIVMASAAVTGLSVAIGLAAPATAVPCTGDAAHGPPPPNAVVTAPESTTLGPVPSRRRPLPTGRRPRGANERAPLPKLGPLISALINPHAPQSAPLQHQAAVPQRQAAVPRPSPPAPAHQPPPVAAAPSPNAAPAPAPPPPPPPADPPPPIGGAPTSLVGWVSGPESPNHTLERFGISGTDLGVMWDNGDPANKQVLMAFGDTVGYCSVDGHQWRYNTLFRSRDRDLEHGITIEPGHASNRYSGSPLRQPGFSKQIINSIKFAPNETGIIPTSGISVGKTQFVNFMSIRDWLRDGEWTTNYSAIAVSRDNGQNWGVYPGTIRTSRPDGAAKAKFVPGNENFQMGAFVKGTDGYLYSFGTPGGRGGPAHVARVPQRFVPDLTKYEYWNGESNSWAPKNPGAATPVIPGPVAEMSVQYNTYLKQYLAMYTNGANDVVARTAPAPQGPWSPEQLLVSSFQIPGGIYAPMMHPWSTGKDVYFNLSLWSAYNVMLMHTVLP
ncbi:DUF4185 domain-containing protein [Mycobacterium spongiae]|uniref:DUF4185 domain-containing protein n=1 Tax=Mycobacterium spongiae TaxID=886343 RepID=A0A975JYQ8_9MYCO|nr:DUF4185 domain-containing protein [Mycobacterium spongiae]QUR67534.1 DUF4185 domain-containing protein [Mycobacterium spongiae]